MKDSSIAVKLYLALALALGVIVLGVGIGLLSLQDSLTTFKGEVRSLNAAQVDILRAESHFKIQVQEWKTSMSAIAKNVELCCSMPLKETEMQLVNMLWECYWHS